MLVPEVLQLLRSQQWKRDQNQVVKVVRQDGRPDALEAVAKPTHTYSVEDKIRQGRPLNLNRELRSQSETMGKVELESSDNNTQAPANPKKFDGTAQ